MCLTKGIFFINHSPSQKTVAPIHDEANRPIKNININDETNPRPAKKNHLFNMHIIIYVNDEVSELQMKKKKRKV